MFLGTLAAGGTLGIFMVVVGSIYGGIGTLPFVVALFVILGLLAAFPDLALWLPRVAAGGWVRREDVKC